MMSTRLGKRAILAFVSGMAVAFAEFGDAEGVPAVLHDDATALTAPPPNQQQEKYLTYTMTRKFLGNGARQPLGEESGVAGMRLPWLMILSLAAAKAGGCCKVALAGTWLYLRLRGDLLKPSFSSARRGLQNAN